MSARIAGAVRIVRAAAPLLLVALLSAPVWAIDEPRGRTQAGPGLDPQQAREPVTPLVVAPPRGRLAPAGPPDLPPDVDLAPVTATVTVQTTRGRDLRTVRQIVTRTADRVHVSLSDGREWLFIQNTVDPRRATGFLVRHDAETIVVHEDSDLRHWQGIHGWADVVMFGLTRDLIATTEPLPPSRRRAAIVFTRHMPREADGVLTDLWWNAARALPERYTIRTAAGTVRFTLDRLQLTADRGRLAAPAERFPGYRIVDLAEWLER